MVRTLKWLVYKASGLGLRTSYFLLRLGISLGKPRRRFGRVSVWAKPEDLPLLEQAFALIQNYSVDELLRVEKYIEHIVSNDIIRNYQPGAPSADLYINFDTQGRDAFRTAATILLMAAFRRYKIQRLESGEGMWSEELRPNLAELSLEAPLAFLDWYAFKFQAAGHMIAVETEWLKREAEVASYGKSQPAYKNKPGFEQRPSSDQLM